ncbi:hypothetical protein [Embleya sp. NBC_00896]|uniref:hypothetical protein n=1 Tax=Embleya sp. NBC_00896 TaxID=2975961 RepID=UPI00386E1102|nr:hypothetical protein OG928_17620 [Embleya sp. NBC_00896]
MRIRLHGTPDECDRAAAVLAEVLEVLDTSRHYADRPPSNLCRVYLTVAPPTAATGPRDHGANDD